MFTLICFIILNIFKRLLNSVQTLQRTIPIENLLFDLFDTFFYATDAVSQYGPDWRYLSPHNGRSFDFSSKMPFFSGCQMAKPHHHNYIIADQNQLQARKFQISLMLYYGTKLLAPLYQYLGNNCFKKQIPTHFFLCVLKIIKPIIFLAKKNI